MGKKDDHRATVRGLGLEMAQPHGRSSTTRRQVRGMISKVGYMLSVAKVGRGKADEQAQRLGQQQCE